MPVSQSSGVKDPERLYQKSIVGQVEALVLQYLPDRLSEEFIARSFNIEIRTLRAAFRKIHGVKPYVAFRARRIEEVMRRLEADAQLTLEAAMRQCGFTGFVGFRSEFRKQFGIDPKEIQKHQRRTRKTSNPNHISVRSYGLHNEKKP